MEAGMTRTQDMLNKLLGEYSHSLPEVYATRMLDLVKLRKVHNDLLIFLSGKDKDQMKSTLHLQKIEEPKQKRYTIKYNPATICEVVPTKLLINQNEDIMVLYGEEFVAVGNIPQWESDYKSEIELNLLKGVSGAILKVEFHPLNDSYLALLTDKGSFALYNLGQSLDKPEKLYEVLPKKKPVSFCFGTKVNYGWESFAVHFLMKSGDVYCLCPVAPCSLMVEPEFFTKIQEISLISDVPSPYLKLKQEFAKIIAEARGSLKVDPLKLSQYEPLLQGPIKILSSVKEAASNDYTYKDITTFDYFPYAYFILTEDGAADIAFTFEDAEPIFKEPSITKHKTHTLRTWVLHNRVLFSTNFPQMFSKRNDPFKVYVGGENGIFRINNEW